MSSRASEAGFSPKRLKASTQRRLERAVAELLAAAEPWQDILSVAEFDIQAQATAIEEILRERLPTWMAYASETPTDDY